MTITSQWQKDSQFFAAHAAKNGYTLEPDEPGFDIQQAGKQEPEQAPTDGAATAALAEEQEPNATAQENLPPELRTPSSPLGYRLPDVLPEHRDQAEQVGRWMMEAGLTVSEGRSVAAAAVKAAAAPMSDAELAIASRKLHAGLQKRWGGDYQTNLDLARAELDRIDKQHNGQLMPWLDEHVEVLMSPHVVRTLVHRALRRKAK